MHETSPSLKENNVEFSTTLDKLPINFKHLISLKVTFLKFTYLKARLGVFLAPVVQKVDNAIRRINHYLLDSAIGFPNTYLLDSDLSDE